MVCGKSDVICVSMILYSLCTDAINRDRAASTVKAKDAVRERQTNRKWKKKLEAAVGNN